MIIQRASELVDEGGSYAPRIPTNRIDLDNLIRWDTGRAMTAAQYEVGRDADATNQMHINMPTGAGLEFSINDVAQLTMNSSGNWVVASGVTGTILDFQTSNSGGQNNIRVGNTSNTAGSLSDIYILGGGSSAGDARLRIDVGSGGAALGFGLDNDQADRVAFSEGGVLGTGDRLRLAIGTGILDVDGTSALAAAVVGLYDKYDDALVLRDWLHGIYGQSPLSWPGHRKLLYEMGVLYPKTNVGENGAIATDPKDPDGYFIRIQPAIHLLAGGIYQTRQRLDTMMEGIQQRLTAVEDRLRLLPAA